MNITRYRWDGTNVIGERINAPTTKIAETNTSIDEMWGQKIAKTLNDGQLANISPNGRAIYWEIWDHEYRGSKGVLTITCIAPTVMISIMSVNRWMKKLQTAGLVQSNGHGKYSTTNNKRSQ